MNNYYSSITKCTVCETMRGHKHKSWCTFADKKYKEKHIKNGLKFFLACIGFSILFWIVGNIILNLL